jgi:hypothetical protein
LLNDAAPEFFRIVQDTLWEDVLLHIARLTDSPQSVGQSNLSIRRLPESIHHAATKAIVEDLIAQALATSKFCKDWRNRHIAHRDLSLALAQRAKPLKPASREKVREALNALVAVLNAVSAHYQDSTTCFECGNEAGGALSLLYVLDEGIKANDLRRKRMENGTYSSDDYGPKEL